ncbi:MAG: alpha/beta hydrolase [Thermoflexales bacterium]|nr:alpha/beta hydrolase [Thermoflexales bacterium]
MSDSTVRLHDGRQVGYAEYGDLSGQPVVFFQGTPSSRLLHPDEAITREMGVRLIVIDRPGFGLSDFKPKRTVLDWADDVSEVLNLLKIERFALVGISGGGPYVAACALKIPQRLTAALMVSSGGPADAPGALDGIARQRRLGYWAAQHAPWLLYATLWLTKNPQRNPEKFFQAYTGISAAPDQAIIQRPEMTAMLKRNYAEATRRYGVRGFAQEVILVGKPWGFRLQDVTFPVGLWHGDCDTSTPIGMARYMAQAMPHSTARYFPGEGHWLLFTHWREILAELIQEHASTY